MYIMKDTKATTTKLSTEAYKGVRDFFPEEMAVEKHIFSLWRNIVEKYGYEEYAASVLEPAELYRAKTGDEIVNEQTYTFVDRGDREVTLRPEMTPTVARMVAARRRELPFPVRWYSIPNLFRYEQPQRGRVREHWQLNVDIFGVTSISAEIELINIAYDITREYGLKNTDFEIRLSNRRLMNHLFLEVLKLDASTTHKISKLIDRKAKMPADVFLKEIANANSTSSVSAETIVSIIEAKNIKDFIDKIGIAHDHPAIAEIEQTIDGLVALGITNARFDPTLMRGFDYYTGIIFEVFDLNPENRRSVFGGGRYDDLLSLFGNDKVTAVGFGAGDMVAENLMETYGKLEAIKAAHRPADIALCTLGDDMALQSFTLNLAATIREGGARVIIDQSNKKTGDKIAATDKRHIPFVAIIGSNEMESGAITIKNLSTKEERSFNKDQYSTIASFVESFVATFATKLNSNK